MDRATRLLILAVFGLHMAFMPVLVLLLPRRMATLFDLHAASALSWLLLGGAPTASVANIAAGLLGDRWAGRFGSRRSLIAIGLAALICSYGFLALAVELGWLILAIIAFQIGLNLTLSPTMALLADHIASSRKGAVAGWMGAALPFSALATTALGLAFPVDANGAFFATAVIVALCVSPLLVFWGFAPVTVSAPLRRSIPNRGKALSVRNLSLLWLARALAQLAACFVLYYLFLQITSLITGDTAWRDHSATRVISVLSLASAAIAMPAAVIGGRVSDGLRARQKGMAVAALVMSLSLLVLASDLSPTLFGSAFIVFQLGLSVYLSVDTAFVAQLIGHHPRRGAIPGVLNLTNTLPAIFAPLLTLQTLRSADRVLPYDLVYMACALGLVVSMVTVLRCRSDWANGKIVSPTRIPARRQPAP